MDNKTDTALTTVDTRLEKLMFDHALPRGDSTMSVLTQVSNRFWIAAGFVTVMGMSVIVGVTHAATWTGAVSDSWGSGTNWAPVGTGVPNTNTETAIISVNPDPDFNTDYTIGELTISGNGDLDLNGHRLIVQDIGGLSGKTTLTGPGSGPTARLTVRNSAHPFDFDTDVLEINSNGELSITGANTVSQVDHEANVNNGGLVTLQGGGAFEVGGELTISTTGKISGEGVIEITGSSDISNSGTIAALGGNMTIARSVSSTGEFNWDGNGTSGAALTVFSLNTMIIDIPIDNNGGDEFNGTITVNQGSEFQVNNPWGLGEGMIGVADQAIMNLNGGGSGPATVSGSGAFTVNRSDSEIHVTSIFGVPGTAVIESSMTVNEGTVIVETDSTLQLDGTTTFRTAANLDLNNAKALIINGTTEINQSVIDLDSYGGAMEVTVNEGAVLTLNVDAIDNDIPNSFGGTININSGEFNANVDGGWECDGRINIDTTSDEAFLNRYFYANATLTVDGNEATDGIYVTGGAHRAWIKGDVVFTSDATVDVAADSVLQLFTRTTDIQGGNWTGEGTVRFDGGTTTVSADTTMNTSVVDLNGTISGGSGNLLVLESELKLHVDGINTATNNEYTGTGEAMRINPTGRLDIEFNDPSESWIMNATMYLFGVVGPSTSHHVAGADVELRGVTNVSGNSLWTARVDVTGSVSIAANGKLILNGGDWVERNQILGGAIGGSGKLSMDGVRALEGYGAITAPIEFTGNITRLTANDGILTIIGDILDVGILGTFSTTGTLNVTNPWNTGVVDTRVENNGGEITGAAITNDGLIEGWGSITAVGLVNNGTITASAGTLVLDSPTDAYDLDGAANDGTLNAALGTLDVREGDITFEGTLNVANGWSVIVDGDFVVDNNTGPGMIHMAGGTIETEKDVNLHGTLIVDTAPSRFVVGTTDPISYIRFLDGSQTTINTDLTIESSYGAIIRPTAVVAGTGRLINSPDVVLFVDEGANVDLELRNEGRLVMGYGAPLVTGVMYAEKYVQTDSGDLTIQIVGTDPGAWDEMFVATTATLDGELTVQLLDGGGGSPYEPSVGESWEIISATGGISGEFDNLNDVLAPLANPLYWHVEYDTPGNRVVLHVLEYLDGDYNNNGQVEQGDLDLVLLNWGSNSLPTLWVNDLPITFPIDADELDVVRQNWGSTTASPANSAVPEPASLLLIVMGLAGLGIWRKRSR